ncbi:MAG: 50S ribosomal protein L28 [Candidatus Dasytiphilus stammeri]
MTKVCQITGKRPIVGNHRSHAMNATKRRFLPNLHYHNFWIESQNRFIRLRVSAKGIRIIDKKGLHSIMANLSYRKNKKIINI